MKMKRHLYDLNVVGKRAFPSVSVASASTWFSVELWLVGKSRLEAKQYRPLMSRLVNYTSQTHFQYIDFSLAQLNTS